MIDRIGYACQNLTLGTKIQTCRLDTFKKEGPEKAGKLFLENLKSLGVILAWNGQNNIRIFRISSGIKPWGHLWKLRDLSSGLKDRIEDEAEAVNVIMAAGDQRLTMHPGPFNCLGSPDLKTVQNTILELEDHSETFNLLGLQKSRYNPINIHIGGAYGDRDATLQRWEENFKTLSPDLQSRLTIENDDRDSLYTIDHLLPLSSRNGIPIKFDFFHNQLYPSFLTEEQCVVQSAATWLDQTPVFHYSESKMAEDPSCKTRTAHSSFINSLPDYPPTFDLIVEVKQKDKAILCYRTKETSL